MFTVNTTADPPGHPLATTAAAADAALQWLSVAFLGGPPDASWTRCADVDTAYVARWEGLAAAGTEKFYGRTHPMASTGYTLGWYAGIAGGVGALFYSTARRVPLLGRADLAFGLHPGEHYPDRVAVLGRRFWCLPDDPDAHHPDATPVPDLAALGAVLRAQVRAHADDFLAGYRPGARLPRRHLLGAFFDGLDSGFWLEGLHPADAIVADAATALPGGVEHFRDTSAYCFLHDAQGRRHLARRRVSCCFYYKVANDGDACTSCPRTTDAERVERLAALRDAEPA